MAGWDFSPLEGRWIEEPPPWDFRKIVREKFSGISSLLDLGTGGGEFLSSLLPLPKNSYCTEGYEPNVKVARDRLRALDVEVVYAYCDDNNKPDQRGALPFKSGSLDLIIDRHESFIAMEVFRVLKKGHCFLTQQTGTGNLIELNELLGAENRKPAWDLRECKRQIETAGFEITETREANLNSYFKDIGAVVCFLLSAPWQIPDFTIDSYLPKLAELHEKIEIDGRLRATGTRFYVKAIRAS
jgi:SAM-dependent methyltransferase